MHVDLEETDQIVMKCLVGMILNDFLHSYTYKVLTLTPNFLTALENPK
jgi:hypothetical protein